MEEHCGAWEVVARWEVHPAMVARCLGCMVAVVERNQPLCPFGGYCIPSQSVELLLLGSEGKRHEILLLHRRGAWGCMRGDGIGVATVALWRCMARR